MAASSSSCRQVVDTCVTRSRMSQRAAGDRDSGNAGGPPTRAVPSSRSSSRTNNALPPVSSRIASASAASPPPPPSPRVAGRRCRGQSPDVEYLEIGLALQAGEHFRESCRGGTSVDRYVR
jgi:hypothetical protein